MGDRIAAVDCGTNSIRLLIAEVEQDGRLTDVHREMRIVRLGQGVDATGALNPDAIERTRVALRDYVDLMREAGVTTVRMVATSATRDARNRDDFFAMTATELGRVVEGAQAEAITGDEEARLSFAGAVGRIVQRRRAFRGRRSRRRIHRGGVGDGSGCARRLLADIGCVRITERCLIRIRHARRGRRGTVFRLAAPGAGIRRGAGGTGTHLGRRRRDHDHAGCGRAGTCPNMIRRRCI